MTDAVTYHFSAEKNALLKQQRGIGFDDIIFLIEGGCLIEIIKNPSKKHPLQELIIVDVSGYAFVVPFSKKGDDVFLKTIYASRVMTKKYIRKIGGKNGKKE